MDPNYAPDVFTRSRAVLAQIKTLTTLVVILLFSGSLGYTLIEGWGFLDGLYMTVITITTVGLREVHELSPGGRVFTIFVVVGGVGTWAYAISSFSQLVVEGEIKTYFLRKRLRKMINKFSDHVLLCGYGRIGSIVAQELLHEKAPFVIIEKNQRLKADLERAGYFFLMGDATQEEVLRTAGIERARCLISALGSDASNVYTTLIARDLNPRLYIIGRSEDETAEDKILRAGADKVISPYQIGARGLAQAATRPHVLNFIEIATSRASMELILEEILVPENSSLAGQTLMGAKVRDRFGIIVIGSRTQDQDMIFNPPADYQIQPGEVLIATGPRESLSLFREAVCGEEP